MSLSAEVMHHCMITLNKNITGSIENSYVAIRLYLHVGPYNQHCIKRTAIDLNNHFNGLYGVLQFRRHHAILVPESIRKKCHSFRRRKTHKKKSRLQMVLLKSIFEPPRGKTNNVVSGQV